MSDLYIEKLLYGKHRATHRLSNILSLKRTLVNLIRLNQGARLSNIAPHLKVYFLTIFPESMAKLSLQRQGWLPHPARCDKG